MTGSIPTDLIGDARSSSATSDDAAPVDQATSSTLITSSRSLDSPNIDGTSPMDSPSAKHAIAKSTLTLGKQEIPAHLLRFFQPCSVLKPKDDAGIPWMVAQALRADGWYLRSEVIWAKKNCMPESVTDRPTKSHEQLFLLAKRPRYFYDADAIREPGSEDSGWAKQRARGDDTWAYGRTAGGNTTNGVGGTFGNPAGRNRRSVWTIATQPFAEAHFACVDEDTECLTADGWKRHDALSAGDLATQYDVTGQTLSWAPVEAVARYQVEDQEMVEAIRRDIRMLLTPNHRCVIQRRHPVTRKHLPPVIVRADELKPSHAVPTAAPWVFDGDTSLPVEWAELLGWYIAEGHESKMSLAVEIYQSPSANPAKCARIEALLRQVGAEWTSATAERVWRETLGTLRAYRVQGYAAARLRELAPQKQIPSAALLWHDSRISALLDGLLGGDGHHRQDGRWSFIQKDGRQAGMVQALAIRLGLSATLSEHAGMHTVYITKHQTRSFRGTNGYGSPIGRARYTGTVWCPKLPHGTWVARRQGRVFITGNTFPEALVRPCIQAGTSERGECSACGAPWVRELDDERVPAGHAHGARAARIPDRNDGGGPAGAFTRRNGATTGWRASCTCDAPTRPQLVLDPFVGSGTSALVARNHGRRAIGIDLSSEYLEIAAKRLQQLSLLA